MSLRYASRVVYQGVARAMKEQGSKCDSALKTIRDSVPSSKQAFRVSNNSGAFATARSDKAKQAEESLRTVMYLSCWGPN